MPTRRRTTPSGPWLTTPPSRSCLDDESVVPTSDVPLELASGRNSPRLARGALAAKQCDRRTAPARQVHRTAASRGQAPTPAVVLGGAWPCSRGRAQVGPVRETSHRSSSAGRIASRASRSRCTSEHCVHKHWASRSSWPQAKMLPNAAAGLQEVEVGGVRATRESKVDRMGRRPSVDDVGASRRWEAGC